MNGLCVQRVAFAVAFAVTSQSNAAGLDAAVEPVGLQGRQATGVFATEADRSGWTQLLDAVDLQPPHPAHHSAAGPTPPILPPDMMYNQAAGPQPPLCIEAVQPGHQESTSALDAQLAVPEEGQHPADFWYDSFSDSPEDEMMADAASSAPARQGQSAIQLPAETVEFAERESAAQEGEHLPSQLLSSHQQAAASAIIEQRPYEQQDQQQQQQQQQQPQGQLLGHRPTQIPQSDGAGDTESSSDSPALRMQQAPAKPASAQHANQHSPPAFSVAPVSFPCEGPHAGFAATGANQTPLLQGAEVTEPVVSAVPPQRLRRRRSRHVVQHAVRLAAAARTAMDSVATPEGAAAGLQQAHDAGLQSEPQLPSWLPHEAAPAPGRQLQSEPQLPQAWITQPDPASRLGARLPASLQHGHANRTTEADSQDAAWGRLGVAINHPNLSQSTVAAANGSGPHILSQLISDSRATSDLRWQQQQQQQHEQRHCQSQPQSVQQQLQHTQQQQQQLSQQKHVHTEQQQQHGQQQQQRQQQQQSPVAVTALLQSQRLESQVVSDSRASSDLRWAQHGQAALHHQPVPAFHTSQAQDSSHVHELAWEQPSSPACVVSGASQPAAEDFEVVLSDSQPSPPFHTGTSAQSPHPAMAALRPADSAGLALSPGQQSLGHQTPLLHNLPEAGTTDHMSGGHGSTQGLRPDEPVHASLPAGLSPLEEVSAGVLLSQHRIAQPATQNPACTGDLPEDTSMDVPSLSTRPKLAASLSASEALTPVLVPHAHVRIQAQHDGTPSLAVVKDTPHSAAAAATPWSHVKDTPRSEATPLQQAMPQGLWLQLDQPSASKPTIVSVPADTVTTGQGLQQQSDADAAASTASLDQLQPDRASWEQVQAASPVPELTLRLSSSDGSSTRSNKVGQPSPSNTFQNTFQPQLGHAAPTPMLTASLVPNISARANVTPDNQLPHPISPQQLALNLRQPAARSDDGRNDQADGQQQPELVLETLQQPQHGSSFEAAAQRVNKETSASAAASKAAAAEAVEAAAKGCHAAAALHSEASCHVDGAAGIQELPRGAAGLIGKAVMPAGTSDQLQHSPQALAQALDAGGSHGHKSAGNADMYHGQNAENEQHADPAPDPANMPRHEPRNDDYASNVSHLDHSDPGDQSTHDPGAGEPSDDADPGDDPPDDPDPDAGSPDDPGAGSNSDDLVPHRFRQQAPTQVRRILFCNVHPVRLLVLYFLLEVVVVAAVLPSAAAACHRCCQTCAVNSLRHMLHSLACSCYSWQYLPKIDSKLHNHIMKAIHEKGNCTSLPPTGMQIICHLDHNPIYTALSCMFQLSVPLVLEAIVQAACLQHKGLLVCVQRELDVSMEEQAILPIIHPEPFYGNPADVPDRPVVFAGLEFKVPSSAVGNLPLFTRSDTTGTTACRTASATPHYANRVLTV